MLGHIVRDCGLLSVIFIDFLDFFCKCQLWKMLSLIDSHAKEDFFPKNIHLQSKNYVKGCIQEILLRKI